MYIYTYMRLRYVGLNFSISNFICDFIYLFTEVVRIWYCKVNSNPNRQAFKFFLKPIYESAPLGYAKGHISIGTWNKLDPIRAPVDIFTKVLKAIIDLVSYNYVYLGSIIFQQC